MRRLILGSKRFIRSATKQGFLRQLGHISLGIVLVTTSILPATYASDSTPLPFLHSLVQRYLPSLPSAITITPGLSLTITNPALFIAVDPGPDTIRYSCQWYKDGILQAELTGNTVNPAHTSLGEVWECVVTPSYSIADTAFLYDQANLAPDMSHTPLTPNDNYIANTPPSTPAVDITPDFPDSAHPLVCSITTPSSDCDGNAMTYFYQWYKDNVLQEGLTTNTIDPTSTAPRQVWKCIVIASDGIDSSSQAFDQVTIVPEATYYVDIDNGDDRNDGRTIDSPFQTISRAANAVQAGDVVHIREGVYYLSSSLRLTTYGTSDNPIVFEAYPGEEVILSGGMVYLNASWNTLANLQVTGSSQQGIYVFGNDNVFENIVTYDNYLSGLQIAEGDRNLLINVISHGNYGGEHTDGIGISSGYQNTLRGCVIYDNSDDGVDTWESSNNTIENCIAYSNGYNGGDGNGFKVGPGGSNIVTRCISYNNSFNGFDTNEGAGNDIYNNTAYNNDRYNFASYYYQNTLRNNISYSGGLLMADGPIQSHNTWNLDIYDPGFLSLDPSSPDFLSLSSDSVALNAGESGVDLGALQYGRTVASLIPAF